MDCLLYILFLQIQIFLAFLDLSISDFRGDRLGRETRQEAQKGHHTKGQGHSRGHAAGRGSDIHLVMQ